MIAAASGTGTKRVTVGLIACTVSTNLRRRRGIVTGAPGRFGVAVTRLGSADVRGGPAHMVPIPRNGVCGRIFPVILPYSV